MKVLLIESESPVRAYLAREISELSDIQVEIQDPGDAELGRMIAQPNPDVVLIDIDHACGKGLEIIKRHYRGRGVKTPIIVAVASSKSLQYRASCLEAGAMFFFNWVSEQDWLLKSLAAIQEELG